MHWAEGVSAQGVFARRYLPGGVCPGGVCHTHPPPPRGQNDMPVKTLLCRNYVVDGKKHNIPLDNRACSLVTKVQTYTIANDEIKQYSNRREFADL